MALSVGFRIPVSQLQSCYQSYGAPTITPVGLSPTERASLRWTHKVRDGLEVRHQAPRQPHQLQVALRLPLQPSTRLDPVQIPVYVDLQQRRGVVARPSRRLGQDRKSELAQVQLLDERVDHPHRVIGRNVLLDALRQQVPLSSVVLFNETLHRNP